MSYARILSRLVGTPLAIAESKLILLSDEVILRLAADISLKSGVASPTEKPDIVVPAKVGLVNVFDSLVAKGGAGESGFTSYQGIQTKAEALIQRGANTIGFYLDTPGGEMSGLFPLVAYIRGLPQRGIRTFAFTDGQMASAGYAIGSAAQQVFATELSQSGSIGALMVHMDQSAKDATEGKTYTILRSKELKALGDSHSPLSDAARAKMMQTLAMADTIFNNETVKSRPSLTVQGIMDMKGDTFMGEDALKLGLIDAIVPDLATAMSAVGKTKSRLTGKPGVKAMNEEELKASLEAALKKNAELTAAHDQVVIALKAAVPEAVTAERNRCLAILAAAETLHLPSSKAVAHIEKGFAADTSLEVLTAIAEGLGAASQVNSTIGTGNAADPDPLTSSSADKATAALAAYQKARGIAA